MPAKRSATAPRSVRTPRAVSPARQGPVSPRPARPRRGGLLGPTTDPELASLGFTTVEALQQAGWEEVCLRWVEAYPLRLNVNAFYGVIAAVEEVDWRDLDEGWRARARALRDRLLREAGPAARPAAHGAVTRRRQGSRP